jgi:hypothetical protein
MALITGLLGVFAAWLVIRGRLSDVEPKILINAQD